MTPSSPARRRAAVEPIDDPADPRLDDYRDVKDPEWIGRRDIFLAEGRSVARTLITESPFCVRSLLVTDTALAALGDLLPALDPGVPVYRVDARVMSTVSGVRFHQGCVAVAETRPECPAHDLLARLGAGPRLLVLLEAVTDPDNVGSIFRSAFSFEVGAVLLSPGCASPLYRKAIRTSMGATLRVPFASLGDWPDGLGPVREAGFALAALTPEAPAPTIGARPLPERLALLLGTEGLGLSQPARGAADLELRIDMAEGADSLNVATAAAIAMHRWFDAHAASGNRRD